MSRRVSANEQGALQGANASLMGVGNLFGPSLFTQVFAFFIASEAPWQLPGAGFLLAALLVAAGAVVALAATARG